MKFPPSVLEEIKARLPVSAVVGKRVRLAKSGREWKGLSPFNAEKTPSFFVNDEKQAWFEAERRAHANHEDEDEDPEEKAAREEEYMAGRIGVHLGQRAQPLINLMEWTHKEGGFILWEAAKDF